MKRARLDLMVEPGNSAKKECRKAERKWCRTKLDSDFLMFKAKKNHATFIIRNTTRNYYTDFIQENSTNCSGPLKYSLTRTLTRPIRNIVTVLC